MVEKELQKNNRKLWLVQKEELKMRMGSFLEFWRFWLECGMSNFFAAIQSYEERHLNQLVGCHKLRIQVYEYKFSS